jgi:Na+-translocating ferredoxin:NAD+ oxidoreductase subunit E
MKNEIQSGIIDRNPVFRLALGLCPALAVTGSVSDALGMGLCVLCVLIASNATVSLTKKLIPQKVALPCHVLIIATFSVMAQIIINRTVPVLGAHLGIYLPLVAVNCLILDRAVSFASQNKVTASILDAAVMGTGFMLALFLCSFVREFLGSFSLFGQKVLPFGRPMLVFTTACGGFFSIALVLGVINYFQSRKTGGRT